MESYRKPYLFSAIVGQDKFKTAYLANIVNPKIGGLLISGPKGTGKSTIVHSIETILPGYDAVEGCRFNCDPARPDRFCTLCRDKKDHPPAKKAMRIINLPLSCTEDRLIGSVDVEKLLKTGEKQVEAGILGEANRNILYIDEVNLLPDHLVDDILDAAASGQNTIEREGISIYHPAEFILVGTMNPEEGELRPQILDRFPVCVKVETIADPVLRVEIVKRNMLYEYDPEKYLEVFQQDEKLIGEIIVRAKKLLPKAKIAESHLYAISLTCAELKVDGQRPDIVMVKMAQTIAALDNRQMVGEADILLAAELALSHRTRDGGLLEPPTLDEIKTALTSNFSKSETKATESSTSKMYTGQVGEINKKVDEFLEPVIDKGEKQDRNSASDIKKKTNR